MNNVYSMDFFPQPKLENDSLVLKLSGGGGAHEVGGNSSEGLGTFPHQQHSLMDTYTNPYQYLTTNHHSGLLQFQQQHHPSSAAAAADHSLLNNLRLNDSLVDNNKQHQQQMQEFPHLMPFQQQHHPQHHHHQMSTSNGSNAAVQPGTVLQQHQSQSYLPKTASNNRKATRGANAKRSNNKSGGAGGGNRGVRGRGESISLDNIVVISPDAALYETTGLYHEELGSINIKDIKGVYKNCRGIWAAQWTDAIGQRHTK